MRALTLLAVLLSLGCGGGPAPRPMPALPEAETADVRLPNGLRLDVIDRASGGVAAVHLRLAAGTVHERPNAAGAAQAALWSLLGDAHHGLRADVRRMGGRVDGFVDRDATIIELVVADDQIAEAVSRLGARLEKAEFDPERWPQLQRGLDDAQHRARRDDARRAVEAALADLFAGHPLARAPLPDGRALAALDASKVQAFIEGRYRPGGARLVIAGEVEAGAVRSAAEDAFGRWLGTVGVVQHPAPRSPGEPSLRLLGTRSDRATIAITFFAPAENPAEGARLDLLAAVAHERLADALQRTGVEPTRVRAYAWAPTGAGAVIVRFSVPGEAIDLAWSVAVSALVGGADVVPPPDRFAAAKRRVQQALDAAGTTVEGLARRRADQAGRWPRSPTDAWSTALALMDPDTSADAARRVFRLERAAAVILAPDAVRTDDDAPWATRLVERAFEAARPSAEGAVGVRQLGEGLTAVVHPMPGARTVALVARLEGGAAQVHPRRAGLAALVAAALSDVGEGVTQVRAEAAHDHLSIAVEVPADAVGDGLDALVRALGPLDWTPRRIEDARQIALARLRAELSNGPARARQLFAAAARLPSIAGTPAALGDLTPATIRAWHAAQVQSAPLTLVLAGAVDPRMLAGLDRRLGRRHARHTRPVPSQGAADPGPPPQRTLDGPDSVAIVGYAWPLEAPASLAAPQVALELLTGPDGVLRARLDDVPGAVGQAFLELAGDRAIAGVRLRAPRERSAAARTALDASFDALITLPVEPEALAAAARRVRTRSRVALRAPLARARWLALQARLDSPATGADAVDRWVAEVDALTPGDVEAFIRGTFARSRRVEARVEGSPPR